MTSDPPVRWCGTVDRAGVAHAVGVLFDPRNDLTRWVVRGVAGELVVVRDLLPGESPELVPGRVYHEARATLESFLRRGDGTPQNPDPDRESPR